VDDVDPLTFAQQTAKSTAMIERAYMRFIPAATAGEGCEGQGTVTAPHLDRL